MGESIFCFSVRLSNLYHTKNGSSRHFFLTFATRSARSQNGRFPFSHKKISRRENANLSNHHPRAANQSPKPIFLRELDPNSP